MLSVVCQVAAADLWRMRNLVGCIRNDIKQRQQSNLASVVNNSCDAKAFTYGIDISDLPLVVHGPLLKRRNISE